MSKTLIEFSFDFPCHILNVGQVASNWPLFMCSMPPIRLRFMAAPSTALGVSFRRALLRLYSTREHRNRLAPLPSVSQNVPIAVSIGSRLDRAGSLAALRRPCTTNPHRYAPRAFLAAPPACPGRELLLRSVHQVIRTLPKRISLQLAECAVFDELHEPSFEFADLW